MSDTQGKAEQPGPIKEETMSQVAPIQTPPPMPLAQPAELRTAYQPPRIGQLPGPAQVQPVQMANPVLNPVSPSSTFKSDARVPASPVTGSAASAYPVHAVLVDFRRPGTAAAGNRFAQRLDSLGIESAEELVKAAATPWKRKWLSFTGTLFMDKATKTIIKAELPAWIAQSDLLRTGVHPDTARLLYYSGVPSTLALANTWGMLGPLDLMTRLMQQAMNPNNPNTYGRRVPTYDELARAIQVARSLPPIIQW